MLVGKEDLSGRVGGPVVDRSGEGMGFIAGTSNSEEVIFTPEHSLQKVRLIIDRVRYTTYPNKGANDPFIKYSQMYISKTYFAALYCRFSAYIFLLPNFLI